MLPALPSLVDRFIDLLADAIAGELKARNPAEAQQSTAVTDPGSLVVRDTHGDA
jgi:hypothetical protein